jgi:hypothetical protein
MPLTVISVLKVLQTRILEWVHSIPHTHKDKCIETCTRYPNSCIFERSLLPFTLLTPLDINTLYPTL